MNFNLTNSTTPTPTPNTLQSFNPNIPLPWLLTIGFVGLTLTCVYVIAKCMEFKARNSFNQNIEPGISDSSDTIIIRPSEYRQAVSENRPVTGYGTADPEAAIDSSPTLDKPPSFIDQSHAHRIGFLSWANPVQEHTETEMTTNITRALPGKR